MEFGVWSLEFGVSDPSFHAPRAIPAVAVGWQLDGVAAVRVGAAVVLRQQIDEKQEIVGADWPAKWTVGREAQLALRMMAAR